MPKDLTPKQQAEIDRWNSEHAAPKTEEALQHFTPIWFENLRRLIKSDFKPQNITDLCDVFRSFSQAILLGSGPSVPHIAPHLHGPGILITCGVTCLPALLLEGIDPHILVISDPNPELYDLVVKLKPKRIKQYRVLLPVTADSRWYSPDSVFSPEQLFFFLPYLSYMGEVELGFNVILRTLIPEVTHFIAQSGSVSNAALCFLNMLFDNDASKRIYLAVDNCWWLTEPAQLRAPYAEPNDCGGYDRIEAPLVKTLVGQPTLPLRDGKLALQSDSVSMGYAIQMLFLIHSFQKNNAAPVDRYRIVGESSHLYKAAGAAYLPLTKATNLRCDGKRRCKRETWAYDAMLKLIATANDFEEKTKAHAPVEAVGQNRKNADA